MIFLNCEQGTDEWKAARVGVITASRFRDAVDKTSKGEPTAKSMNYAAQVALERVSGQSCDETFVTWQMKRGTELEPLARIAYEADTGNMATESGIAMTDDRMFGYSTDGEVEGEGLIEIKCVSSALSIIAMWRDGDMSDYMHQMQGGMWITGRKWCDFVMYCPQLEKVGKQLFRRRVMRDDNFIDEMVEQLMKFEKAVAENERILRLGSVQPEPEQEAVEQAAREEEGAKRFAEHHPSLVKRVLEPVSAAPAHAIPPSLRLGQICERLGFTVTAAFLAALGFEPAGRDKSAVLFHEHDFAMICAALQRHISAVQAKLAA